MTVAPISQINQLSRNPAVFRLVVTAFWVALAGGMLFTLGGGDPAVFIRQGSGEVAPRRFGGYDGQFAYEIARDPLGAADRMDIASVRYQRILYPILAWALSFGGSEALLPWVLLGINIASAIGSTLLLGKLLERRRTSQWYAFSLAVFFGMVLAVFMDLNEPLSLFLALLAIDHLEQENHWTSAWLFALSGLTKETALIFPAGILIWALLTRRIGLALKMASIGIAPIILWGLVVRLWIGASIENFIFNLVNIVPFSGMQTIPGVGLLLLGWIWSVIPLAFGLILAIKALTRSTITWEIPVLIGNALLVAFLPNASWNDLVAPYRLLLQFIIISLLFTAVESPTVFRFLAVNWGISFFMFVMLT